MLWRFCFHLFGIQSIVFIYRVGHLTFFSTSAYFVNGNTQLMSDVTNNQFYPSAEQVWFCIPLAKWACDPLIKDADFDKKIIFSEEAHFDLAKIWVTENPLAYIEKPTHTKQVTVWYGFWSRGIILPFFFENEQEEAVTVNGDRYRAERI